MNLDSPAISVGQLLTILINVGSLVGIYVGVRVAIAKLEVKADKLIEDVNTLWNEHRKLKGE